MPACQSFTPSPHEERTGLVPDEGLLSSTKRMPPFLLTTTANSGKADFLVLFIHFIYLLGRLLGRIKFGQTLGGSFSPGASQMRGPRPIRSSIGSTQTVLAGSWICTAGWALRFLRAVLFFQQLPVGNF